MSTSLDQTPPSDNPSGLSCDDIDSATRVVSFERLCVLLAAVLVGLSLAWAPVGDMWSFDGNKHHQAKKDMSTLFMAVEMYQLRYERVPKKIVDLAAMGIILKERADLWGSPYELHTDPERTRWAIRSAGPDRKHGTLDDLYEFGS